MISMRETAEVGERLITYSAALNEALREEMRRDPRVFILGEDIAVWGDGGGVFSVTKGLVEEFGRARVRDTPISEEAIVGVGVGAAATGMRPVVELMYSDFITLVMDPLVNQAAKLRYMSGGQARVPLVVRTNLGASGGKAAQHSQSLETWLVHTPGLKVVVPSTPSDAKGLLKTAIRDDNPVVFLEHKLLYFKKGAVPADEYLIPFGQAVIRRPGHHATVVATQAMLEHALVAADELGADGIELEVIDPRTLVPLDIDTIVGSVMRTNRLLICHEAVERGGWAGEVALQVMERAFDFLDAPIARVCGANLPFPYSAALERNLVPGANDIVSAVRKLVWGGEVSTRSATVSRARGGGAASRADAEPTDDGAAAPPSDGLSARRAGVILPRLSDTMEEATILRWLKRVGEPVVRGEGLVEVETDKATIVIEADRSGVLDHVMFGDGQRAPVGSTLGVILVDTGARADRTS
jgi:pyruvate dehydrogenase E1 component beta subunit